MHAQRRGNQIQQGRLLRERYAGEITMLVKLLPLLAPLDTRPIIKALQREVYVLIGFQLHHRQSAIAGAGKHVDHGTVGGRKCGYLRVG